VQGKTQERDFESGGGGRELKDAGKTGLMYSEKKKRGAIKGVKWLAKKGFLSHWADKKRKKVGTS